jgi:hypothetical protein
MFESIMNDVSKLDNETFGVLCKFVKDKPLKNLSINHDKRFNYIIEPIVSLKDVDYKIPYSQKAKIYGLVGTFLDSEIYAMEDVDNSDKVHHPNHYQSASGLEVIEVIQTFDLDFELGNVVKYVLRRDKKGTEIEDLKKAIQYLEFEILKVEQRNELNER